MIRIEVGGKQFAVFQFAADLNVNRLSLLRERVLENIILAGVDTGRR